MKEKKKKNPTGFIGIQLQKITRNDVVPHPIFNI